ncbi:MAG: hypothetical protein PHT07_01530 [Paludibacter sp.]|nr:hypothetical protein [Paludibacter sp.]
MILIKNFYWKIFFSAYWLAYDLGEKKTPEWNATGFLKFTSIFNMFGLIFIVNFVYGGDLPYIKLLLALTIVSSFVFNKLFIYSKKYGFENQIKSYEYLSKPERKRKRNRILIFTLIFTFGFMITSMVINNPSVKSYLIRLL